MPSANEQALLRRTLRLLATYAWHQRVALEPTPLGVTDESGDLNVTDFVREFRIRHAVAAAQSLPTIVESIEANPSHESSLIRSESRGTIRGRLDLSRYLARRATLRSAPRRYPIVCSQWTFSTPENLLTRIALEEVHAAMRDNPFTKRTAESTAASDRLRWARNRMNHRPWCDLVGGGLRERLYNEVDTRVRRRQTGNDALYQRLLDWFDEWALDLDRLGAERQDAIVNGLLAFPTGESFWEKVFEVWCIIAVADAADSLGWDRTYGPTPLHQKKTPVFRYSTPSGHKVVLRYQKQEPMAAGRWRYRTGAALRGIPDISLAVEEGGFPLLVDAKYRFVPAGGSFTRSEETYKMLGYAENFRATESPARFRGILIFPTDVSRHRTLDGPEDGRLDLVAMNISGDSGPALAGLSEAIADWEKGQ